MEIALKAVRKKYGLEKADFAEIVVIFPDQPDIISYLNVIPYAYVSLQGAVFANINIIPYTHLVRSPENCPPPESRAASQRYVFFEINDQSAPQYL